jgi:hypothetical protein
MADNQTPHRKQLETAETLLAAIQHQRDDVPYAVKREIRDYFSSNERGAALNWNPEDENG